MTVVNINQPSVEPQAQDDPFTLLIKAMWDQMIQTHQPLVDLVQPGNMVMRHLTERPGKPKVQDADLPELDIMPVGNADQNLYFSSHGAQIIKAFDIGITSGSKNVQGMFRVEWELIRAISKVTLRPTPSGREFDFGYSWVKKIDIVAQSESLFDSIRNRKRSGWTGLMTLAFTLVFDRETQLFADVPQLRSNPSED